MRSPTRTVTRAPIAARLLARPESRTTSAAPAWVRARAVAMSFVTVQAALAVGSVLWGIVASWQGTRVALLAAAATFLVLLALKIWALVDALLAGTTIPRRLLLTAKATLFENAALALLLHSVGVVPLRRVKDELRARGATDPAAAAPARNVQSFELVTAALRAGRAVLIAAKRRDPLCPASPAQALADAPTGAAPSRLPGTKAATGSGSRNPTPSRRL